MLQQSSRLASLGYWIWDEENDRSVQASEEVVQAKGGGLHGHAQQIHVDREHVIGHEIEALTRAQVARSRTTGRKPSPGSSTSSA